MPLPARAARGGTFAVAGRHQRLGLSVLETDAAHAALRVGFLILVQPFHCSAPRRGPVHGNVFSQRLHARARLPTWIWPKLGINKPNSVHQS